MAVLGRLLVLSLAWATMNLGAGAAAAPPAALEYAVKASYLYKFTPFVQWPAAMFDTPMSPFNLCVLGQDPFGPLLDQAVDGQMVESHPIVVRRIARLPPGESCHLVYLGRSSEPDPAAAPMAVPDGPVLTVTDEKAGTSGGVIHFVLRAGRVRFEIDPAEAAARGVTLSSKLLSLALPRGD
jgi:hypothetical protein